jgi:hypothetical protein
VTALVLLLLAGGDPEKVTGRYRALTLDPGERRELYVPGLDRVTASSGQCLEEGMVIETVGMMWIQASCAGVRTSLAWLKDGKRVHVMVCAEDETRTDAAVKLRKKAQGEVKAWKGITACIRGQEVHLLGWAQTPAEQQKVAAVAKRWGLIDKVELLGEEERED